MTPEEPQLDTASLRILDALQQDAELSNAELAERVNLSASPCWRRVADMRERGVIRGSVALVDPVKLGLLVNVFTDPFVGYFRNLYIFGQPAEFVSVVTKITSGVTLVNSLLSTVCAVILYIALRPALEKAHLLPKE